MKNDPYYVSGNMTTTDEPSPGWYYTTEDEHSETEYHGPFIEHKDALMAKFEPR